VLFRDCGMQRFLSIGDSTRTFNTLRKLALHEVSHWVAGGPPLAISMCSISTEGAPSLRFLQGWASMLPAQLLSVLHYSLCMPSSYPPFAKKSTRRTGHPQLWWLPQ
jgi:hypothetical protein